MIHPCIFQHISPSRCSAMYPSWKSSAQVQLCLYIDRQFPGKVDSWKPSDPTYLCLSSACFAVFSCNSLIPFSEWSLCSWWSAATASSEEDASSGFQCPLPSFCFFNWSCLCFSYSDPRSGWSGTKWQWGENKFQRSDTYDIPWAISFRDLAAAAVNVLNAAGLVATRRGVMADREARSKSDISSKTDIYIRTSKNGLVINSIEVLTCRRSQIAMMIRDRK